MSLTNRYKFKIYDSKGIDLSESMFDMQRIALDFTEHKVRTTTNITDNANKHWVKTENTFMRERKFNFKGTICGRTKDETCIAERKMKDIFSVPWNPNCWEFFRIERQDRCWDIVYWAKVKVFTPFSCTYRWQWCLADFKFCLVSEKPEYYWVCQQKEWRIAKTAWIYFEPKPVLMETETEINFKWEYDESLEKKARRDESRCCIVCNAWNTDAKLRIEVTWWVENLDIYNQTNWSRIWVDWITRDFLFDNTNILEQDTQAIMRDEWVSIREKRKKGTWVVLSKWENCITFDADSYSSSYKITLYWYDTYV